MDQVEEKRRLVRNLKWVRNVLCDESRDDFSLDSFVSDLSEKALSAAIEHIESTLPK